MVKQLPIHFPGADKTDVRSQLAAICYRIVNGKVEILLVTSRRSGRWIVPKGWPKTGRTPAASAAEESWEEAGVIGKASDQCIGIFSYAKTITAGQTLPCMVMAYPMHVKTLAQDYPEKGQRQRKWFSRKKAARRVDEPELAQLLRDFDPRGFG